MRKLNYSDPKRYCRKIRCGQKVEPWAGGSIDSPWRRAPAGQWSANSGRSRTGREWQRCGVWTKQSLISMRIISDPIVPRKFFLFKRKNCAILYEIKYTVRACDGIGRHAGFRFPCFQRVGSSPFRRTKADHHDEKSWWSVLYELHTNGKTNKKGDGKRPSPFAARFRKI